MCCNLSIMKDLHKTDDLKHVYLPDGTIKMVENVGVVKLNEKLTLTDVLHIPSFKYNLLFVNKLTETGLQRVIFYAY